MERLFLAFLISASLVLPAGFIIFDTGDLVSWKQLPVMESARKDSAKTPDAMGKALAEGYLSEARRQIAASERAGDDRALQRACALIAQAHAHDAIRAEDLWNSHCASGS